MAETEMGFKQAQGEMRAMLKMLRCFENVNAVLSAAADAGVAQVNAEAQLAELLSEIAGIETNLAQQRAQASKEQNDAAVEMERLRVVHFATEAKFKSEADETRKTRERCATEVITASELISKQLKTDIEGLRARKVELEEAVAGAHREWNAMRKRMGVE